MSEFEVVPANSCESGTSIVEPRSNQESSLLEAANNENSETKEAIDHSQPVTIRNGNGHYNSNNNRKGGKRYNYRDGRPQHLSLDQHAQPSGGEWMQYPNQSQYQPQENNSRTPSRNISSSSFNSINSHGSSRNSSSNELSSMSPSGATGRLCAFFAQGTCRNGGSCRFSHDASRPPTPVHTIRGSPSSDSMSRMDSAQGVAGQQQLQQQLPQPLGVATVAQGGVFPAGIPLVVSNPQALSTNGMVPPVIINIPPGQPIFCIDVECVATGVQHNARSVAQVALVDEWGRPIFNVLIKQDLPVASYLTPLTGLTKESIDQYGLPLAEAMALLRAHLPPNAILVGQNILKDVQWLQLAEGVDYSSLIDLASLFRVWDPSRRDFVIFSQDHTASVWMGLPQRSHHDALTDAAISISLFNTYRTVQWDINRFFQLQIATLSAPRIPGFSSLYPVIDGCW